MYCTLFPRSLIICDIICSGINCVHIVKSHPSSENPTPILHNLLVKTAIFDLAFCCLDLSATYFKINYHVFRFMKVLQLAYAFHQHIKIGKEEMDFIVARPNSIDGKVNFIINALLLLFKLMHIIFELDIHVIERTHFLKKMFQEKVREPYELLFLFIAFLDPLVAIAFMYIITNIQSPFVTYQIDLETYPQLLQLKHAANSIKWVTITIKMVRVIKIIIFQSKQWYELILEFKKEKLKSKKRCSKLLALKLKRLEESNEVVLLQELQKINVREWPFIPKILHKDSVLRHIRDPLLYAPIRFPCVDPTHRSIKKHVYEKGSLIKWIKLHKNSPQTRLPLTKKELIALPKTEALINSRLKLHQPNLLNPLCLEENLQQHPNPSLLQAAKKEWPELLL